MTTSELGPLSGEELAALRQMTEEATLGPWTVEERKMGRRTMLVVESRAYSDEEPGICGWHSSAWPLTDYDAAYIAALSPSVVARLLAMVERAQEWEQTARTNYADFMAANDKIAALQEAADLLDRVEISEGRDTFDGSISGGAPCDVDLFAPGPKYDEWERAVRANRKARAARPSHTETPHV